MTPITPASDLSTVLAEAESLAFQFHQSFSRCSSRQLNWRPSPGEWSISACLEHLTLVNRSYLPTLSAVADGRFRPTLLQRIPLLPRLFGPLLIRSLMPGARLRLSAPPAWQPSTQPVAPAPVDRFIASQQHLITVCEHCSTMPITSMIISSPAVPLITYSLLDALRIIVVHQQHHFSQAARLPTLAGFPSDG
jgi:hypothetical protein